MDWGYIYTSFEGRLNRESFCIGSALLLIVAAALQSVATDVLGTFGALIFAIVWLYPALALSLKRAHDRNIPTWVVALFFTFVIMTALLWPYRIGHLDEVPMPMFLMAAIPAFLLGIFLFVELTFLQGTGGPNRYEPTLSPKRIHKPRDDVR
jgi:uncharacterized membrane protein YhaH (DUF805 family)